jgi:pimeloyl-ACP methyl ester carboxylesterase
VAVIETEGARIAYARAGRGPAVLLIQGVGAVGGAWQPQVQALADRFALIAPDNRGIGASAILDGSELSIEAMAADALAVMDAEGIERFHVAGHSMGGLIAQQLALRARERVASLALLCTFARGRQGSRIPLGLLATALRSRIGTRAMRRSAFLELIVPRAQPRGVDRAGLAARLANVLGHDLAVQPPIAWAQLRAMGRFDVSARLAELSGIRTVVISAADDRIAPPAFGRELAAAIPGARFEVIPDAGHAVPVQNAAAINRLLAEHWIAEGDEGCCVS